MADILQLLVAGLATGGIYALVAIGFTLLWQTSQTINFAQGEFVMLPAFFVLIAMSFFGLSFWPAVAVGGVVSLIVLGLLFKKWMVDPMIRHDRLLAASAAYLGGADPRTPLAAPIYADLRRLPPLLIQVGGDEALLDDSVRLAARARAADVDVTLEEWPEMIHVWQAFVPILPEAGEAIARIGAWAAPRLGPE